jgi:uncharacterized protein
MAASIPEFISAVKSGDLSSASAMLDSNPELVSARDDSGTSVLLTAAYYRHSNIAALLIERGASVNFYEACAAGSLKNFNDNLKDEPELINTFAPDGFQPIGLAAFFGHTEIVRLLLNAGAEVDTQSKNGMAVTPLNSAAAGGNLEIARLLLEHGANPNTPQAGGFVPLHAAAQNGNRDMIELLLRFGANKAVKNNQGKSALDFATEESHKRLVDLLQ